MLTYRGKQVYDIFKGDIFRVVRTRQGKPSSEAADVEYTCLDSMQSNNGFFKAKDDSGIGPYMFNTVDDDLEIISRANPRNERLAKNRPMKLMIRESSDRFINDPYTQYYDPELEQFEIFLMTRGTDGQDEIRDYVDSRRDTGIFGSIGSEYGNISVWVNTESIDDEFMDEVEALIDFAQDHGARLNVKCFNELKDLLH